MSLYQLTKTDLASLQAISFSDAGYSERADLQRLLIERVGVISPNTMVVSDEFGYWEDSKRRIDLLCIDRDANLVVVELKRTEDGGHMELQAIRYAAMVSTMTFEQVVDAHAAFRRRQSQNGDEAAARTALMEFLGWASEDEANFGSDVRIVLASADFSKEITTTVMWLNERDLDIRCVRLKPYRLGDQIVLDVQQVIPLPEALDLQIRIREKEHHKRSKWTPTTVDEVMSALEQRSPEERRIAEDLYNWLTERGAEMFPTSNGFAPRFHIGDEDYYCFKITQKGMVVVWFNYLKDRKAFSDDAARLNLLQQFNEIPGVSIPPDRLAGKPSFALSLLEQPNANEKFRAIIAGIVEAAQRPRATTSASQLVQP